MILVSVHCVSAHLGTTTTTDGWLLVLLLHSLSCWPASLSARLAACLAACLCPPPSPPPSVAAVVAAAVRTTRLFSGFFPLAGELCASDGARVRRFHIRFQSRPTAAAVVLPARVAAATPATSSRPPVFFLANSLPVVVSYSRCSACLCKYSSVRPSRGSVRLSVCPAHCRAPLARACSRAPVGRPIAAQVSCAHKTPLRSLLAATNLLHLSPGLALRSRPTKPMMSTTTTTAKLTN